MKKLIPALCMLLIAAVMLGTSTYAWFSMNRTVTATGMQVRATTASDLYIYNGSTTGSGDALAWGTAPTVDTIATAKQVSVASIAKNDANELTPSSTTDYATWFYLANSSEIATGGGVYSSNPAADKVSSIAYNEGTPNLIKGYVQVARCYVAMKDATTETKGNLSVTATLAATNDAADDMLNVLRCAVVISGSTGTPATAIYSVDGDTTTKPLTSVTAINGSAVTTVASGTSSTILTGFSSNVVYTITIYTWFEGQDSECVNANTVLSENYTVSLSFNLA